MSKQVIVTTKCRVRRGAEDYRTYFPGAVVDKDDEQEVLSAGTGRYVSADPSPVIREPLTTVTVKAGSKKASKKRSKKVAGKR